ncbi:glycosyltransferase family A protein [Paraglaciecola sp. L3A3]|uniref:glycosyltransferase family 2 protein n=1 Tax=Paraglaciecola sp. L3A3 TaxID=2686358 RepID=UPI00131C7C80|nr:glycosyltransferase family A protein [Paraglaciecola sp. L3A3]
MKIAIVTPLKNEIKNLPLLIEKVTNQNIEVEHWVIVENGSDDGSKEFLEKITSLPNVKHLTVLNFTLPVEKYELGIKYATVVNQGFEYLSKNNYLEAIDFVGILDADCFPDENYYQELTTFMNNSTEIGISSGLAYSLDGKYDGKSRDWVRGNCRLWKQQCFLEAGYFVGPSADALSVCKAELKGWKSIPMQTLSYKCRDVGENVNYSYYGYSAYYRGIPPAYAFLKAFKYLLQGSVGNFTGYFKGYFGAWYNKKPRINDSEILEYFSNYYAKKLKS